MKAVRIFGVILLILMAALVWVFAQTTQQVAPKKFEPTAFEKRCSICHNLQDVRRAPNSVNKRAASPR